MQPATGLDVTQLLVVFMGGAFNVIALLTGYWINTRMKDVAAAATLDGAVKNALGAMQSAATAAINGRPVIMPMPMKGVPQSLVHGVQYVIDHAGAEAERFGITPQAIADKIAAQVGLSTIVTATAVAAAKAAPSPIVVVPSSQKETP